MSPHAPLANGHRSLLHPENVSLSSTSSSTSSRVGEVAGVTVAECAAVCCCPCAVFNLLILTFYRLPAGLCRRALRRRRRRRGRFNFRSSGEWGSSMETEDDMAVVIKADGHDMADLEKDVWEWFNEGGFWRSASQRMKLNNPL